MPVSINNTTITFNDATTQTTAAVNPIPTGTVMLFYQAAAPTGWTQVATQDNKALRVVSGTGGVAGGSVAFTTAFASQAVSGSVGTSGATTLSTSQIPSHQHSIPIRGAGGDDPSNIPATSNLVGDNYPNNITGATGGGGSHTHTGGTFTGTAINLAVSYIDIILASKN